jgi:ceramide synthetase
MFLILTLAQFILNWGVRRAFMYPVARCLFGAVPTSQTARLASRARRKRAAREDKFAQSAMEAFFYSWYFAMGGTLIWGAPWFWPSEQWWEGDIISTDGGGLGAAAPMPRDLTCFYVAYAARYMQGLVSVFLEVKRKDFWEMVIHHATTIVLIYLSFVAGMTRVGLVVMVLLDFADPFLHVAKCCKYVSESQRSGSGGNWGLLSDIWFGVFAVSFTLTRNVMYPYVLWSAWIEGPVAWRAKSLGGCSPGMDYMEMLMTVMQMGLGWCMLLLAVLQVLQLIWQYFLMKAIVKVVMGQELKDTRSDSESEGVKEE